MKKVLITTSWDDGSIYDLKLAALLLKYKIPATFYIPVINPEREVLKKSEIKNLSQKFEIGGHSYNHTDLTQLNIKKSEEEITKGKKFLEDTIGKEVTSFCYPKGLINEDLKQEVGFSGFSYARTISTFATSIGDILKSSPTIHASNHNFSSYLYRGACLKKLYWYLLRKGKINSGWEVLAKESLDYCLERGGIFHLWGHSWEIEKRGDWNKLEKVFDYINNKTLLSMRVNNRELVYNLQGAKKIYYSNINPKRYYYLGKTSYYQKELEFLRRMTLGYDRPAKYILDLGCGCGRASEIFNFANYIGIDFSKSLIDFAKEKYQKENKNFFVKDYSDISKLSLQKFDLILLWGIFESDNNPLEKIRELFRYVKQGTRIIVNLNNSSNPLFLLSKYIRNEFFEQPFPFTSFTPILMDRKLTEFCKDFGFKYRTTSFGLLPPSIKIIPPLNYRKWGVTIVFVLDKI
jgi:ubiquinone/menaquinone biosynthesis C-methylase UbiE